MRTGRGTWATWRPSSKQAECPNLPNPERELDDLQSDYQPFPCRCGFLCPSISPRNTLTLAPPAFGTQDYTTAIEIFSSSEVGKVSKEVAQLSAGMCLAYLALEKYEAAFDWNERAYKAAKRVFGETSWQVRRFSSDHSILRVLCKKAAETRPSTRHS